MWNDKPMPLSGHLRNQEVFRQQVQQEPMPPGHLWFDGVDYYFAVDLDHLAQLYEEHTGSPWEDVTGSQPTSSRVAMREAWDQSPIDETKLAIQFDDAADIVKDAPAGCEVKATGKMGADGAPLFTTWWATATRLQWFAKMGHGLVASTEW